MDREGDDTPVAGREDEGLSSTDERASEGASGGWGDWTRALRDVAPYLDLGWRIMGATAAPVLVGAAFDYGLGTGPWGVLVGAGVGILSAGLLLVRIGHQFGDGGP